MRSFYSKHWKFKADLWERKQQKITMVRKELSPRRKFNKFQKMPWENAISVTKTGKNLKVEKLTQKSFLNKQLKFFANIRNLPVDKNIYPNEPKGREKVQKLQYLEITPKSFTRP